MSGFAVLFNWLGKFWNALEIAFKWVLDGFILLIQFVTFTILDGLFSVVESGSSAESVGNLGCR